MVCVGGGRGMCGLGFRDNAQGVGENGTRYKLNRRQGMNAFQAPSRINTSLNRNVMSK